jgi:hypothetical protein
MTLTQPGWTVEGEEAKDLRRSANLSREIATSSPTLRIPVIVNARIASS